MKKPLIGITCGTIAYTEPPFLGTNHIGMQQNYAACIQQFGGIPVLLPLTQDKQIIAHIVQHIDGLIVSGGDDVQPLLFNQQPHPLLGATNPIRDTFDIAAILEAETQGKPVLGICRGEQVMNVAYGGSLWQDVSLMKAANPIKHVQQTPLSTPTHTVNISSNTILHQLLGDTCQVNTCHHMAVKDVAPGFLVAATAPDGTIEAIVKEDNPLIMGVQWHPEWLALQQNNPMAQLFSHFVKSATTK